MDLIKRLNRYCTLHTLIKSCSLTLVLTGLACVNLVHASSADQCSKSHQALSKLHSDTIAKHKSKTDSLYASLHNIEDKLFTEFNNCPDNPLLLTLMGEVQISLGNVQLAFLYAKKSMSLNGKFWQTHHLLGTTYCMQEDYETGLPHLEKAVSLAPDNNALQFNLCSSYHAANKHEKAINACTTLINIDKHQLHGPAYYIRSQSYSALNQPNKAKSDLNSAKALGYQHSPQ